MKTPEEFNALKEEALEQVVGGVITTEGDPTNPGNPNPDPNPIFVDDPTNCNCRWEKNGVITCSAPISSRTEEKCKYCTAEGLFTFK